MPVKAKTSSQRLKKKDHLTFPADHDMSYDLLAKVTSCRHLYLNLKRGKNDFQHTGQVISKPKFHLLMLKFFPKIFLFWSSYWCCHMILWRKREYILNCSA